MDYLENEKDKILRFLNEFPYTDRRDFQIIISKNFRDNLSDKIFDNLNLFCIDEIHRPIHISPFVKKDITVVNNKKRPIEDILELEVL